MSLFKILVHMQDEEELMRPMCVGVGRWVIGGGIPPVESKNTKVYISCFCLSYWYGFFSWTENTNRRISGLSLRCWLDTISWTEHIQNQFCVFRDMSVFRSQYVEEWRRPISVVFQHACFFAVCSMFDVMISTTIKMVPCSSFSWSYLVAPESSIMFVGGPWHFHYPWK